MARNECSGRHMPLANNPWHDNFANIYEDAQPMKIPSGYAHHAGCILFAWCVTICIIVDRIPFFYRVNLN